MFEDLYLMDDKRKSIVFIIIILMVIILMGKVLYTLNNCSSIEKEKLKAIIEVSNIENKKDCYNECLEKYEIWAIKKEDCKDFCGSRGCYKNV